MSKIISYSIFGSRHATKENYWIFAAYMRGIYWNTRMNFLLYPGWRTHVEIDSKTFSDYDNIFYGLRDQYGLTFGVNEEQPLCRSMLWRLKPIFFSDSEYVMCRDADAITTHRERRAVEEFINSGWTVHAITDNEVHGTGLMGGMIGFGCKPLRDKYESWDKLLDKLEMDYNYHGSDQQFLNRVIWPDFKSQTFAHYLNGAQGNGEAIVKNEIANINIEGVGQNLRESNLTARHIGSAGVVDLELIRFFKRHDKETQFEEVAKRYPKIFYWL